MLRHGPREFSALVGYLMANRDGINTCHRIRGRLRIDWGHRAHGIKSSSGVEGKNMELKNQPPPKALGPQFLIEPSRP